MLHNTCDSLEALILMGPHKGVRDFSLIRQWLSQIRFPFSCHSQNWKCALSITPKTSPRKTTSFNFVVMNLPLLPHVYFLTWFADSNSSLTAPLWVSMATTAWESTAACLRAAQAILSWRHTVLFMFPGWACRQAWPSAHPYRGLHHAAWLAWLSVMWRQARSGGPDRINTL